MRLSAFILARGGSKGLPGKNTKLLGGKPLIHWTIHCAQACADIDDVIVSTDADYIADAAREADAEVMMRPDELASDTALPKDAIRYHMQDMAKEGRHPDIMILLQPTSPLRAVEDIQACVDAIVKDGCDSAATFVKSPGSPYRAWTNDEKGLSPFVDGFDPWQPRQALPETYALNGAVYAVKTDVFLADDTHSFLPGKNKMVLMPSERSVDIDTALDLVVAEAVLQH